VSGSTGTGVLRRVNRDAGSMAHRLGALAASVRYERP